MVTETTGNLLLKMIETVNLGEAGISLDHLRERVSKMHTDERLMLYNTLGEVEAGLRNDVAAMKFTKYLVEGKDGLLYVTPAGIVWLATRSFNDYEKKVIDEYFKKPLAARTNSV
jgi:hypothetical protein